MDRLNEDALRELFQWLGPKDLLTAGQVCKGWSVVSRHNVFWRRHCRRWSHWPMDGPSPWGGGRGEGGGEEGGNGDADFWLNCYKRRVGMDASVRRMLGQAAEDRHHRLSLLGDVGAEGMGAVDAAARVAADTATDLTRAYYAGKVLIRIKDEWAMREWYELGQEGQQTWEAGSILIAQFYRPTTRKEWITKQLDNLATKFVRRHPPRSDNTSTAHIPTTNQNSPLHHSSPNENALSGGRYTNAQIGRITELLTFLCEEEGFEGNRMDYYSADNSCIDQVLKTRRGIPITLSLVFFSVASRAGIPLEMVNYPRHFLLRFADSDGTNHYIDVFNKRCLSAADVPSVLGGDVSPDSLPAADGAPVLQRMVQNLLNVHRVSGEMDKFVGCLSLSVCFDEDGGVLVRQSQLAYVLKNDIDFHCLVQYALLQLEEMHGLDFAQVRNTMNLRVFYAQTLQTETANDKQQKTRNGVATRVRYQVGQVFTHRLYGYVGVITGWDEKCSAGEDWILRNNVQNIDQPFYSVLGTDNSSRYVAEANVQIVEHLDQPVTHFRLGKYFRRFVPGRGYEPNIDTRHMYPDDTLMLQVAT